MKAEKKCLLIAGGEKCTQLPEGKFDLVIAVDKGVDYAAQFGIVPDVIIGDLDSVSDKHLFFTEKEHSSGCASPLTDGSNVFPDSNTASGFISAVYTGRGSLSEYELELEESIEIGAADGHKIKLLRLAKKKDDPDTLAAVRYALNEGASDLTFCCIMGGRFDQMLSNLQIAAFAAEKGASAHMLGDSDEIHVFRNASFVFPKKEGWSLSAFSLSDNCSDVCISGALYPAEHLSLKNTIPLGLSNEWVKDAAEIRVSEGLLAVVLSRL